MSNYNSNYSVIDTNTNTNEPTTNNTKKATSKKVKPKIYEDFCIFGNFFGLVPDNYVKYFNLFALQLTCTLMFAGIYYILLCDFDNNFFIQPGFPKKQFLNYKWGIALIMSINFQTTTAYVDLKCKNFLSRSLFALQIVCAFAITFLFFL
jgi:hypothetical protein